MAQHFQVKYTDDIDGTDLGAWVSNTPVQVR